jgi:xylulokinase
MQTAGGARDWLARSIGEVNDDELDAVPPGAHGLIFLPYLIGERSPWWDAHARGAFVGLTMTHGRAEMARAVLEGVAFNLRLILDILQEQGRAIPVVRLIGGGARSQVWTQILADAFAKPIARLDLDADATAWGAAVAGGIGVGLYADWAISGAQARITRVVEPRPAVVEQYADRIAYFGECYRALEPLYRAGAPENRDV